MDVIAAYNGPDTATTIVENVEVLAVAQITSPNASLPPGVRVEYQKTLLRGA